MDAAVLARRWKHVRHAPIARSVSLSSFISVFHVLSPGAGLRGQVHVSACRCVVVCRWVYARPRSICVLNGWLQAQFALSPLTAGCKGMCECLVHCVAVGVCAQLMYARDACARMFV